MQNPRSTVPSEVIGQHQGPIDITGDETIYESKDDTFTVRGHAVMTQGATVLHANEIVFERRQRIARAVGNVHLLDPEIEIWASRADVDLDKETLELDDANILAREKTYHLKGRRILKQEGQKYVILNGFFTTCGCEPGTPDWSVSADKMDVHMGGTGRANNAKFSVLGFPVIPLPYVQFPADSSRHSGFLTSRQGQSGLRGFQYLQPYYWAINKSSDATFAFDLESSQRLGGLGEYRLTNGLDDFLWVDAAYYNEFLRSSTNRQNDIVDTQLADPNIPVDRYGIIGTARQHITPDLIAYGDTITVSDSLYLREMNTWTLSRGFGSNFGSMRDAISHFGIIDQFENGFGRLQGTWHADLIQDESFALQQLPDLWISGRQSLGNLAYLDYDLDAVEYWRRHGENGMRLNATPQLTVPWRLGDYLYGFARGGAYGTLYDSSGHTITVTPVGSNGQLYNNGLSVGPLAHGGFQTRFVPYVEAAAGSELEKVYNDVNWGPVQKLKHTIEPFVSYSYVTPIDQSDLPLWDQIDRVNRRSLLTYGVTSRLFARLTPNAPPPARPVEENPQGGESAVVASSDTGGASIFDPVVVGTPGQSDNGYNIELASLTVTQAFDTNYQIANDGIAPSDIDAVLSLFPTSLMWLGSETAYDPRTNPGISYASVYAAIRPPWEETASRLYMGKALQGSFLQVGYFYVRQQNAVQGNSASNAAQFLSARAYTDLFDRAGVYFGPNYNLAARFLQSAQYGLRLKSPCDCWALDTGITDSFNPSEVSVQVQLTLGGLGSLGQSPFGRNPFGTMGIVGNQTGVLPTY